jgi:hypothetical protein
MNMIMATVVKIGVGIAMQALAAVVMRVVIHPSNVKKKIIRKNNQTGFLIICASSRSTDRYNSELSKKGSPINSFFHVISNSTKCSEKEAEESFLRALLKKQEEAFTSVALEKGLFIDEKKKMDAVNEAMLSEAGLCNNNTRILLRHLNHFFGKGRFESEHTKYAFFH